MSESTYGCPTLWQILFFSLQPSISRRPILISSMEGSVTPRQKPRNGKNSPHLFTTPRFCRSCVRLHDRRRSDACSNGGTLTLVLMSLTRHPFTRCRMFSELDDAQEIGNASPTIYHPKRSLLAAWHPLFSTPQTHFHVVFKDVSAPPRLTTRPSEHDRQPP